MRNKSEIWTVLAILAGCVICCLNCGDVSQEPAHVAAADPDATARGGAGGGALDPGTGGETAAPAGGAAGTADGGRRGAGNVGGGIGGAAGAARADGGAGGCGAGWHEERNPDGSIFGVCVAD